ncbi:MAG: DUF1800 domain-containing protein [Bryobacterales bacterium]|nr:DUF1800 domain-containing protein [Bryobacterales bacterium]MBV9398902.1 DUF1800 domain-containing protein [Bryobacterales bacterium]
MKRWVPTAAAALAIALFCLHASASGPFDKSLSPDQQILHALNRLTFGPRPGDMEEVRRIGLRKWIDLQLHPERIPENAVLDARLKPLETLRMEPAQIVKDYPATPPGLVFRPPQLQQLLSQDQMRAVLTGTAEERMKTLASVAPEKRGQVLSVLAPNLVESPPELKKEAEEARKAQAEERQKEQRRIMPPLSDLLNPDQVATAQRGNPEQVAALFAYLEPAKRQQVAAALPAQALSELPGMRRLGMKLRQPQQIPLADAREGKVFRALYSNRQLEEVLVDFWLNHFNVYENKNVVPAGAQMRVLLASYERDAIRPHVFGHFKDLLLATARHPAMLYYLDNWESASPEALEALKIGPFAGGPNIIQPFGQRVQGINENYGRELMELHTLGVNGGYTQQDVIAVARCFTGWTVRSPTAPEFAFANFMHDAGEKVVLGRKIAAGGEQDGLQVIDILARHPSTAKFISKELAQRFVADDPPQALVDRMAQSFLKTDGDLRAMMETMFNSPEFFSEGAWLAKVKSPLEIVVSAVRAMPGEVVDTIALAQKIADLGEPLYGKLEPTGYPNTNESWLNTASLLGRINFATALVSGQISGVRLDSSRWDGKDADSIARELLGREASAETREAMQKGLEGKEPTARLLAGLAISSPDFQRR